MNSFDYFAPSSVDEALDLLVQKGDDAKVVAGGTGLVNMMKQRLVNPEVVIGLGKVSGLDNVSFSNGQARIGALVRHQELVTSPEVRQSLPLLAETYRQVATVRVRNFATVGGGLVHGDPNQDPQVSLLALNAEVSLRSKDGTRSLPLSDFMRDYYETAIRPDELLTDMLVPLLPSGAGTAYLKFLPRTADDYATVSAAAVVVLKDGAMSDVRLAFGSAAPTAKRCPEAERMLTGQKPSPDLLRSAADTAKELADPVSDGRGSAAYKKDMVPVFVRRALEKALERAGASGGNGR
ncbi:MAG TPA: xanthine dehydrogenase family protein subunit M [Chloroflexota bacterium]|nr:xanthine dehydrogenase family protein subunit M [Chloroflexota bacterium]